LALDRSLLSCLRLSRSEALFFSSSMMFETVPRLTPVLAAMSLKATDLSHKPITALLVASGTGGGILFTPFRLTFKCSLLCSNVHSSVQMFKSSSCPRTGQSILLLLGSIEDLVVNTLETVPVLVPI